MFLGVVQGKWIMLESKILRRAASSQKEHPATRSDSATNKMHRNDNFHSFIFHLAQIEEGTYNHMKN